MSDGDVICAWLASLAAAGRRRRQNRRHVVVGRVNCRDRFPELRDNNNGVGGVYMQNLLGGYMAPMAADLVAAGSAPPSLAAMALAHRRALAAQATTNQLSSQFRRYRDAVDASSSPRDPPVRLFNVRAGDVPVICNNSAGLRIGAAIDFGPAVVPDPGDGARGSGRVVVHYTLSAGLDRYLQPRFFCLEHDDGGYWIQANASPRIWEMIKREIGVTEGSVSNEVQEKMDV